MRALSDTTVADSTRVHRRVVLSLLLLTALGIAFRLWSINARGLWLDEALTVLQARQSLSDLIETMQGGVHPPLFHILMHFWVSAFGATETAVRGFAAVWGVLSIPAAYFATRSVYDRRSGLIAAGITAVAPYLIWYSQEARMYTMMLFFGFMSLGFLSRAIRGNRARDWVGYSAFTLLGLYTQYFFAFLVMGQALYFVFVEVGYAHARLKREGRAVFSWWKPHSLFTELPKLGPWLLSMAFLAVTYGYWLSGSLLEDPGENFVASAASGQGLGYGQVGPTWAPRFNDVSRVIVEMIVGFQSNELTFAMIATWPLVITLTLVLFDYMGYLTRRSAMQLWALLGILVIFGLGQWQGQVLASRYFIALVAPAVVLIAGVLGAMPTGWRRGVLIAGALVALVAWYNQSYSPNASLRFGYREAFGTVISKYQPGDVVIYEPFFTESIVMYYLPEEIPAYRFPQHGAFGAVRRGKLELAEDLSRTAGPSKRVWIVLSFQDISKVRGDAYNTLKWFERNGYELAVRRDYNRVSVLRFEREAAGPVDLMEVRQ